MKILVLLFLVVVTGTGCGTFDKLDHVGDITMATPYDFKSHNVKRVLRLIKVRVNPDLETIEQIERYNRLARGWITYKSEGNKDHWQIPSVSKRLRTGDCEDFAIWVYAKMLENGMTNVRLVIGDHINTRHAWLNWYYKGEIYIIDPTISKDVLKVSDHPHGYYKPIYSFDLKYKWYHTKERT